MYVIGGREDECSFLFSIGNGRGARRQQYAHRGTWKIVIHGVILTVGIVKSFLLELFKEIGPVVYDPLAGKKLDKGLDPELLPSKKF